MPKLPSDPAALRVHAAELKKQIQALGGLVGGAHPGFEEAHPEFMIKFYERVLAEEKRLNPQRPGAN